MSDFEKSPGAANLTIEGMLDSLFARAMSWEADEGPTDVPSHIAILPGSSPENGLEVLQLLNWATKDTVEIVRPTLDAPSSDTLPSIADGTDVPILYRISVADMFGRPFSLSLSDGETRLQVPSLNYDVFAGKIALWGVANETVVADITDLGTPSYSDRASGIIEVTDLHVLVKDFDLDPDQFLS